MKSKDSIVNELFNRPELIELANTLEKIASNTESKATLLLSLSSGMFGLLGAWLVQHYANKRAKNEMEAHNDIETMKLKVDLVDTERLRQLNELSDTFVNLQAEMDKQKDILIRPYVGLGLQNTQAKLDEMSYSINLKFQKFAMLLDTSITKEKDLFETINEMIKFLTLCFQDKVKQNPEDELQIDHGLYSKLKSKAFSLIAVVRKQRFKQIESF